jgi:competence protein ComEA
MKKFLWMMTCCAFLAVSAAASSRAVASAKSGEAAAAPAAASPESAPAAPASGVVNINEAGAEQLVLLPGVGPSRAEAIIAYRKSHPFKRVEELVRVKGIGKKSFARLRPLLSLSGPTTLKERPRAATASTGTARR